MWNIIRKEICTHIVCYCTFLLGYKRGSRRETDYYSYREVNKRKSNERMT